MKRFNHSLIAIGVSSLLLASGASAAEESIQTTKVSEAGDATSASVRESWLAGKVETAFLFNKNLNNFTIDVDVKDDIATLDGTVTSDVQKDLAEQVALTVDGISEVKNNLTIDKDHKAAADEKDESFAHNMKDAAITASVKLKLLADDNVAGTDINVDTSKGIVTLSGKVNSDAQRDLAEAIAKNVDDVNKVENRLKVSAS